MNDLVTSRPNRQKILDEIRDALREITGGGDFAEQSERLLNRLNYFSDRKLKQSGDPREFLGKEAKTSAESLYTQEVITIKVIFQITSGEVENALQRMLLAEEKLFDEDNEESFIFYAVELREDSYNRTDLANITRVVNSVYNGIPCVVLFKHKYANKLSMGLIGRRPHKRKPYKDVLLKKVSLIKDIDLSDTHRAHLDILAELSLTHRLKWMKSKRVSPNFKGLLKAWLATLDVKELNKRFYRELSSWFEWAKSETRFPTEEKVGQKQEEHIMRLLVRILFVWFIKEKGLVDEQLFNPVDIREQLKEFNSPKSDSYYRAILQNLFFATLNTEIEKRAFSSRQQKAHRNFNLYRYKSQMEKPDKLKALFDRTPFINGGLFDCLDDFEATGKGGRRIDCFSDNRSVWSQVSVPDRLFFALADSRNGAIGLIELFKSYKFTVEENTPIEQDVALDPELLGQVFEELLDEIEGDTRGGNRSNRKDTGSYYTPREVVDYMVNQALIAELESSIPKIKGKVDYLLDYAKKYDDANVFFDDDEIEKIVRAIAELRILDPAVGSGAFPMGVLNKLNLALHRLDPNNEIWKKVQIELATEKTRRTFEGETDENTRKDRLDTINRSFERHKSGFGRKRYLIQNCIFGVDIQPIACQIAKLRFFISLAIEQNPNDNRDDNYGIQPLPNLETRFVSADTLTAQDIAGRKNSLKSEEVMEIQNRLETNRERHFDVNTRQTKWKIRKANKELRKKLTQELIQIGVNNNVAERVANWDPYDQNARAKWFDPNYMFGIQDGFDIVIGNPPYTGLQKNGGTLANLYEHEGYEVYSRTGGIYVLFYERGHQLLARNGHLCYITSRQWLRARYGAGLRAYLSSKTLPLKLIDLRFKVFEANVDVNILLLGKQPIKDSKMDTLTVSKLEELEIIPKGKKSINIPQNGGNWLIPTTKAVADELLLREKVEGIGIPLKEWEIKINYGIKTGCNQAFVITDAKRREILTFCGGDEERQRTENLIKPLLLGKKVRCHSINRDGEHIIVVPSGWTNQNRGNQNALAFFSNNYPEVYEHMKLMGTTPSKGKGLYDRKDQGDYWWELRSCDYYAEFEKEKLVGSEIVTRPQFVYDDKGIYTLDTTFIMTTSQGNLRYICGVLNSDLGWYIFKNYYAGPGLGKDKIRYKKKFLEWLPIPLVTDENKHIANEIESLVDLITTGKKDNVNADTKAWERSIDELVCQLYKLKKAEIKMVEEAVKTWR